MKSTSLKIVVDIPILEVRFLKSKVEGFFIFRKNYLVQMRRNEDSHEVSVVQYARLHDHSTSFWVFNPWNCVHFHFNETASFNEHF